MLDVYLNLLLHLKEKQNASDSARQNINQDLKRIADKLKEQLGQDDGFVFDAAMCYYVSGYYVQAQGLAKNAEIKNAHVIQKWIFEFLAKDFKKLSEEMYEVVENVKYQDVTIQGEINSNGLSTSDAVERIVTAKVAEGLLDIISFIEIGDDKKTSHAKQVFSSCQKLLFSAGEWKLWWWIECLKIITDEFVENSLWHLLMSMQDNAVSAEMVTKYIIANYKSETIVELWRTQVESLPKINDVERCSFCVSVPTSAGKTKVGELAILRFLLDYQNQPDKKCVYIAPLKKLCLEVEESFRNVFSQMQPGIVSAFYGYHEVDVFDDYAIRKARVLIVTPEKLDGMLRQYPDLASQIKLVIADEGHLIGGTSVRNYKYRFLLERLIHILSKKSLTEGVKPRIIFVSGVLPHMEEFSELISGSRNNVVEIKWRPIDEPPIGSWEWNGKIFNSTNPELPAPLPFPINGCEGQDKFEEYVVRTAIQCAMSSETMVFSASKRTITDEKLLNLLDCIVVQYPQLFQINIEPLPTKLPKYHKHQTYYHLLEKGIAIHHAGLPDEIEREIQRRIYNGQVRLLFASPTLAQGVNIPFNIVLVYRLQHGYLNPISDEAFWNVVGRVGRPVSQRKKTNASLDTPKVLFLLNKLKSATFEDKQDIRTSTEIQKQRGQYQVTSPFLNFLTVIREKISPSLTTAELINGLAEKQNLHNIIGETASLKWGEISLEQHLIMLDSHLFDLLHEVYSDVEITLDWLQQSTKDLVDLFVKASDIKTEDLKYIQEVVVARLKFIAKNIPKEKRRQDYLLGLPFNDCEKIKEHREELLSWYQGSMGMFSSDPKFGMDKFVELMSFVADLSICQKKRQSVKKAKISNQMSLSLNDADKKTIARNKAFQGWLSGASDGEIEQNLKVFYSKDFSQYRESVIDKIPWGISAIGRYLNAIAKEKGLALSADLEYLPSLAKYGVDSKIACQLTRLGISRKDAIKISNTYKEKMQKIENDEDAQSFENDFSESVKSLNIFADEELRNLSVGEEMIKRIAEIREQYKKETINLEPEFPPSDYPELSD